MIPHLNQQIIKTRQNEKNPDDWGLTRPFNLPRDRASKRRGRNADAYLNSKLDVYENGMNTAAECGIMDRRVKQDYLKS